MNNDKILENAKKTTIKQLRRDGFFERLFEITLAKIKESLRYSEAVYSKIDFNYRRFSKYMTMKYTSIMSVYFEYNIHSRHDRYLDMKLKVLSILNSIMKTYIYNEITDLLDKWGLVTIDKERRKKYLMNMILEEDEIEMREWNLIKN